MITRFGSSAPELARAAALDCAADAELARVLRICDPGPITGALTFSPTRSALENPPLLRGAWRRWQAKSFAALLAPALLQAVEHAAHGRSRELLALDRTLCLALGPATQRRVSRAGRTLLHRLTGARAARWVGKFQAAAALEEAPAAFPVIYAAQCALFHIAPRLVLLSYGYLEWSAAARHSVAYPDGAAALSSLCPLIGQSLLPPAKIEVACGE